APSTQPSAWRMASMRVLPMRPAAPFTAIRSVIPRSSDIHVIEEILHSLEPGALARRLRVLLLHRLLQLLQQIALVLGEVDRGLHHHPAQQVAGAAAAHRGHPL